MFGFCSDCDSFKKTDLKLQQSVSDLVLSGVVAAETGTKNLFSFSAISKDASSIDQQFTKFKNFVSEASEPFKSELSFVLFPIFVHLYLELVSNGQKSLAQKFHGRHRGMFQSSDQFRVVVDMLPNISSASDVPSHPQIKEFKVLVFEASSLEVALCSLLGAYFVFNIKYPKEASYTLEFLQRHIVLLKVSSEEKTRRRDVLAFLYGPDQLFSSREH
ncbi:TAF5-like RNA polymerase II p300/CBP-associated factor-associated factor 65 kDa subunit 5L [Ixodes scapularis]